MLPRTSRQSRAALDEPAADQLGVVAQVLADAARRQACPVVAPLCSVDTGTPRKALTSWTVHRRSHAGTDVTALESPASSARIADHLSAAMPSDGLPLPRNSARGFDLENRSSSWYSV